MPTFSLPSYEAFSKLRLDQFLPLGRLALLENWEFLDHLWVGQALGFTSMLQLASNPSTTRAIEVDLKALNPTPASSILNALGLVVTPGMSSDDLIAALGPPIDQRSYVADRTSYDFVISHPLYHLHCTCLHDGGLIFFIMYPPLPALVR